MDRETFTLRKKFLEEFFKDRMNFNTQYEEYTYDEYTNTVFYKSNIFKKECYNEDLVKKLNEFGIIFLAV